MGACLATFTKEEILMELENRKVDGLQVCLIGRIEPEAEYLCKIFHFCMEVIYPSLVLVQTRKTHP